MQKKITEAALKAGPEVHGCHSTEASLIGLRGKHVSAEISLAFAGTEE